MESKERPATDPLTATVGVLLGSPRRVGFYRAIELLERVTHGPRIGDYGPVNEESIRFRHDPSLTFATSDVSSIVARPRRAGETGDGVEEPVYEITTTFLGLTGTVSPLPTYIAEEVLLENDERPAQREFLDVFHHRILSLFYRAHARYSFTSDYVLASNDAWSRRSLALAGIDTYDDQPPPVNLTLKRLLRLAPLLATRARTAQGLVAAVSDVMEEVLTGAPVAVEQFVGRWVTIEERQLLKLGIANTTLGVDATIGRRVFDRGGKFRLVLGPLKRRAFQQFLPGGAGLAQIKELVTFYVRDPLEFDLELILAPGETPSLRLSASAEGASRLGLDSWVTVGADRETRVIVPVPMGPEVSGEHGATPANDDSAPKALEGPVHGTAR